MAVGVRAAGGPVPRLDACARPAWARAHVERLRCSGEQASVRSRAAGSGERWRGASGADGAVRPARACASAAGRPWWARALLGSPRRDVRLGARESGVGGRAWCALGEKEPSTACFGEERGKGGRAREEEERRGKEREKKRKEKENGKKKKKKEKKGREKGKGEREGGIRAGITALIAEPVGHARRPGARERDAQVEGKQGVGYGCRVFGESGDPAEQGGFRTTGVRVSRRDLELNDEAKI